MGAEQEKLIKLLQLLCEGMIVERAELFNCLWFSVFTVRVMFFALYLFVNICICDDEHTFWVIWCSLLHDVDVD